MGKPSSPYYTTKEAELKTGLTNHTMFKGAEAGWFPVPIEMSPRIRLWLRDEIDRYVQDRISSRQTRGAPQQVAA